MLVADDDEDARELAKILLDRCCACRVVEAEDGTGAVEQPRRERVRRAQVLAVVEARDLVARGRDSTVLLRNRRPFSSVLRKS